MKMNGSTRRLLNSINNPGVARRTINGAFGSPRNVSRNGRSVRQTRAAPYTRTMGSGFKGHPRWRGV